MAEHSERSLEERLAALEATVESLQRQLAEGARTRPSASRQPPGRQPPSASAPSALYKTRPRPSATPDFVSSLSSRGAEFWISRVGIGLLLLGLVFLFKYAVDQGWLTPTIRVSFGVALGLVLAAIGFRVHGRKRWFAQIMLGGAAATWYVTGFAAFQLLRIVSFPVAFAFMVAVTVFTFWVALRQNEAVLAVIAAIGGLGTPFFLYTETGSVPRLMAYTCLILAGTGAIYLVKGWRTLLWTTAVGSWLVVGMAFRTEELAQRVALQAGIVVIWLIHWLVPVARAVLAERNPGRWSSSGRPDKWRAAVAGDTDLAALTFALPVLAFFLSRPVWGAGAWSWGTTALAAAALYALVAWYLHGIRPFTELSTIHGITAGALVAIGLYLLVGEDVLIVLWAVEATGLHLLARRLAPSGPPPSDAPSAGGVVVDYGVAGTLLYLVVGLWLLERMVYGAAVTPAVLNGPATANAAVIALALLSAVFVTPKTGQAYRLAAHAAVLVWLARELSGLNVGSGLVTVSWGVYALGLLAFVRAARKVAVGTLFLAVGKLVLYDLRQIDPLWRILLFLGFGAVFLVVSYYASARPDEQGER